MCGRYALALTREQWQELFGVEVGSDALEPRYDVAPSQTAPVIGLNAKTGQRGLAAMRWGLVPHWAEDISIGNKLINARSETVAEKPSFREAFRSKRCLIPVSGFYEWHREGNRKQPYYFQNADAQPMALAGLWATWTQEGEALRSYTILTTTANSTLAGIHDRMPVILSPEACTAWLDPGQDVAALQSLLVPYDGAMNKHPVSTAINKAGAQGAELTAAVPQNSA